MSEQDYLLEKLRTIHNLVEICLLLRTQGINDLLPTAMELLYQEVYELVDEHCVVREDGKDNIYWGERVDTS